MPEIILIDTRKPQETKSILLTPENQLNQESLLGRDGRSCIVLDDSMASRTHGKIAFRNGSYYYSDLGSRNGSKINNLDIKRNQEYLLKSLDTITVGRHLLWVKAINNGQETPTVLQSLTPDQYMPLATIDTTSLETWTQGKKQLKCVQIINETADVKTFSFISDPPVKFNYQPGQFVTLSLDINGKKVKRSYSISSTPSRPHSLEITVKRVPAPRDEPSAPPGLVSNWLHDHMRVGSQIEVNGPMGKFTNFANPSNKLLLISAGSGITPMMSMSRWICDTVSNINIVFVHSARSPEDIIFRQELEMMSARYPNFELAITITRPQSGQSWCGYTGRINDTILPAIAPDYKERTVYVCGSNPFMKATKELLQKIHFPMENYYEESFGGPKKKKKSTPKVPILGQTAVTRLQTSSGRLIPMPAPVAPSSVTMLSRVSGGSVSAPVTISTPSPANTTSFPSTSTTISSSTTSFPSTSTTPLTTPSTPKTTDSNPVVVLAESGQEISCDGDEPILDVVEAEGIDLPCGCRVGACGACKVRKIAGEVTYDDDVDCDDGYVLTCVAKPLGKVTIEA
ncbi:FAD-binding oxidoreductase [Pleurocapsa sp. PCC 7319]|uniref:FAD-binding oxidoreductase n=1 Tax=Pleurocapsa sp. PCC 7319 TaxID=118161 RepID=UPI000344B82D|nr:FAD-binding oxidoreductase [Pleurocapsa sp. PCC 7319]